VEVATWRARYLLAQKLGSCTSAANEQLGPPQQTTDSRRAAQKNGEKLILLLAATSSCRV